jgi:hypothetical protein
MNYTRHLLAGGLFALASAGVGLAAIPTSVINVRTNAGDYTVGAITSPATANYRLTGVHNWTSNNIYMLYGIILVGNGATLNIQEGTIIRGVNSQRTGSTFRPGMLIVERGGKIYAKGTANAPICMTDEWDNNFPWFGSAGSSVTQSSWDYYDAQGSKVTIGAGTNYNYGALGDHHGCWGGLVLCGKAFVNWDDNTTLGSGEISVEGTDGALGIKGGGSDDNDSSGEISYLQVRYGGYVLASTKEINGVTFYGVGRGTKVDHIEVYNNIDDAFEWFGGTVNAKYLVAWGVGDDIFDSDAGYRGKNQFLLGVQRDMGGSGVESGASDKGMEIDGYEKKTNGAGYLYANSLWANVTLVGMQYSSCRYYSSGSYATKNNRNVALTMRDNASPRLYNSIVMDFGAAATLIENRAGADLTGDLNTPRRFEKAPTAANFPSVTYNGGATAGMDATAVLNYLYGDGVLADEQQAAIRGTIFFNCPAGLAYAGVGPINGTYDWVSSSAGGGPWVSTGQQAYSGFTNDVYNYNLDLTGLSATDMPIKARARYSRAMTATTSYVVTNMDPRAANAAVCGAIPVPDQWLTPVRFCGAFAASNNWAKGWTTIDSIGALAAAPGGDVVVGGAISVPLASGTTTIITNTVTTTVTNTVTNGVSGIVYQANGAPLDSGTGVTNLTLTTSPVLTYTLTTAATHQLQSKTNLADVAWTVLKTFTPTTVPVTINLTDIVGETPPNAGDSRFYRLVRP